MKFDNKKAFDFAMEKYGTNKPGGFCCRAVREILEVGLNRKLERRPSAKMYSSVLSNISEYKECLPSKEMFTDLKQGDVFVFIFDTQQHAHIHGHISIVLENEKGNLCFFSDFKQKDIFGASYLRNEYKFLSQYKDFPAHLFKYFVKKFRIKFQ